MARPESIHDARIASRITQFVSEASRSGGGGLLGFGSLVAVLVSAASSIVAYGMLSEQMRIHWTLGLGPYYGPEFAQTAVVLSAFPVLMAGIALGAYWLDTQFRHIEEVARIRPYYAVAVLGTLGIMVATQGALIIANL